MKTIAVITGASSGIGKKFAETISEYGVAFDEVWVIARRKERLEELALPYPVRAIALDLTKQEAIDAYAALLREEKPEVKLLINCSGFGKFCAVTAASVRENRDMVALNCMALMSMCQVTVPYMSAGSHIVNMASVAAYQPIPYINVYGATKAFVLSFSRALNRELRDISVMASCPYWTSTEFFDHAVKKDEAAVVKTYIAMYRADQIVSRAWRDLKRGKDVSKFGFVARAQILLTRMLPHRLVMWVWMKQQKLG